MKAVLVRGYGDVNQLFYGDTPDLKPGSGRSVGQNVGDQHQPHRLETPSG